MKGSYILFIKSKMTVTLQDWFRTKTIYPLTLLALLVFSIWLGFVSYHLRDIEHEQTKKVEEVSSLLQTPIMRNDRESIETLMDSLYLFLDAKRISLCKNQQVLLDVTGENMTCNYESKNYFYRNIKREIGGLKSYSIIAILPVIGNKNFLYLTALGLILMLGCFYVLFRFGRQVREDVLKPIEEGYSLDSPIRIYEVQRLLVRQELAKKAEWYSSRIKIAKQVVHDVRSPLSALQIVASKLKSLPRDQSNLLNNSIERISEILDDLKLSEAHANKAIQKIDICTVIKEIISEKLAKDTRNIYDFKVSLPAIRFEYLDLKEFRRVLSNIINNSLEAMPLGGTVSVSYEIRNGRSLLVVGDTGHGMSVDVITKIGDQEFSHGKDIGQGLGLSHAYKYFKSIGGEVRIDSIINKGTQVYLFFDKVVELK